MENIVYTQHMEKYMENIVYTHLEKYVGYTLYTLYI